MKQKFNPVVYFVLFSLALAFLFGAVTKCSELNDLEKHGITTTREIRKQPILDSIVHEIDTVDSTFVHYCYDTVFSTAVLSNKARYVDSLAGTAFYADSVKTERFKIYVYDTVKGTRIGSAIRYSYSNADTVFRYRTITNNSTEYRTVYKPPPVTVFAYAQAGSNEFSAGLDIAIKDQVILGYSYSPLHHSHNAKIGIKLFNINRHGKNRFNNKRRSL